MACSGLVLGLTAVGIAIAMAAGLHTSNSHSGHIVELLASNPTVLDDFDASAYAAPLGFFFAVLVATIVPSYVYVKSLLPVMRKGKFTLRPAAAFDKAVQDFRPKLSEEAFKKTRYGRQRYLVMTISLVYSTTFRFASGFSLPFAFITFRFGGSAFR